MSSRVPSVDPPSTQTCSTGNRVCCIETEAMVSPIVPAALSATVTTETNGSSELVGRMSHASELECIVERLGSAQYLPENDWRRRGTGHVLQCSVRDIILEYRADENPHPTKSRKRADQLAGNPLAWSARTVSGGRNHNHSAPAVDPTFAGGRAPARPDRHILLSLRL